jgi:uncharacterized membrane protein
MRIWLLLAFAANALLTLGSSFCMPDTVATHFGWGGTENGWSSRAGYAAMSLAIDAFLLAVFIGSGWLTRRVPSRFLNVPNRDYWCLAENRGTLEQKTTWMMALYGVLLFAFLFGVKLLVLLANRSVPVRLNEAAFFTLLGVFAVGTAAWLWWFYRSFRVAR